MSAIVFPSVCTADGNKIYVHIGQFLSPKAEVIKFPEEMQQHILERFVEKYNAQKDPMFQKVWKSQKEFLALYTPYMELQSVDAEVDVNK